MGKEKLGKTTSGLFVARARVGVGLLFGFFALLCFSHPASAASYLNVSSGLGGAISFGRVNPVASGTSATTSDTLTINTNCTVGYSVYVSAQNGKGTSLVNTESDVTTNNTIPTSSAAVGSAASLANNTWGISPVDDGTYFGLPAYASATSTAFTTKSDVGESSTVPVYYGIKATTALVPGTYTGDILYTVLPDSACSVYTIHFDANGGTGTMNNQAINVGSATALSANTFTRSGYTFLGWSESANGKTGTAVNGIGTAADIDYTNVESVTDISDFNTTKNLYAIWAVVSGNMQNWTGCSSLASGSTIYLTDTRDSKVYAVKKLADNNCWMTDNLTLGASQGYALTMTNTNIQDADTATYYLPQAGYTGTLDSATTTGSATFDPSTRPDQAHVQYRAQGSSGDQNSTGTLRQSTGYYNFYAATLGCSYYGDNLSQCASGYIQKDICPKGWQLPTSGQFVALDIAMNGGTGNTRTDATARDRFLDQASFLYSGYYYNSRLYDVGSSGDWWSSTVYGSNHGYRLYLTSSGFVTPRGGGNKYSGTSVRCIAQDNYIISYNTNGADSGTASKASETTFKNNTLAMPTQGTMTKSGYNFLGWALTSNAATAIYTANQSVSVSDLLTAASAAGQTTTSGSTITLYAVWEQAIDGYMQSWTSCSSLSVGQTVRLQDTRDSKVYVVKKLPDNKCWMMQNLTIGSDGAKTLTSTDTNIDDGKTYYLPPAGKQGSSTIDNSSTLTATDTANFTNNSSTDQHAKTQFRTKDTSITNDSDTGYYNFYTATLGFSYYSDGKTSGSSTRDICPKGWRLPWTSDSGTTRTTTADFYVLATSYNSSASWTNKPTGSSTTNPSTSDSTIINSMYLNAASPLATSTQNNYAGFSYAGVWNGTSAINVGSDGYYWSSSVYSTDYGYGLSFNSSSINPQRSDNKSNGRAVRCVAKDPTMQDFDASASLPNVGDSMELTDTRDGNKYTVKRLPDGKVWMMQNLTIGMDGAKTLTSADTNINDGKTYYLPPAGKQGSSTIDNSSTLTATTTANFTTSNDNHAKTQFRSKNSSYTNDSDTGYYNFYTATLGFSYYGDGKTSGSSTRDICPKGWRLPKTTDNGSSVASGSPAEFATLAKTYNPSASWTNPATSFSYYTSDSTIKNSMYLSAASPLATSTQNSYAGFSYAGYWYGTSTSAGGVGTYGVYWSSSVYDTNDGYPLYFISSDIRPHVSYGKSTGLAVRCVSN